MTTVMCKYCGVSHASYQSHCSGCGGDMPPVEEFRMPVKPQRRRREWIAMATAAAAVLTVASVLSNKLSGPQQVEIVGLPAQSASPAMTGAPAQLPDFEPGSVEHRYLMNAHFAGAYTAISPLRMLLLEHRQMEGDFPHEWSEVGINAEELADGRYVTGVDLLDGGVLRARLSTEVFGNDAVIVLKPVDVMSGMQTRWVCTTTVKDELRVAIPGGMQCPYAESED